MTIYYFLLRTVVVKLILSRRVTLHALEIGPRVKHIMREVMILFLIQKQMSSFRLTTSS